MMAVEVANLGIGSRIKHPAFGVGVIIGLHKVAYDVCFVQYGIKEVGKNYEGMEVIEGIEPDAEVSFTEAEQALVKILHTYNGVQEIVPMGDRWKGGTMILKPGEEDLKSKEIPIETFFHKIVMVRDRLRVMEQRINSAKELSEESKVNLQQYLTRIYGSLTTFNVLFKNKDHSFRGEKTKE